MKALQEKVLASVPKGSQDVTLVSEQKDPVTLNGHETYEVTVAYKFYGQDFQISVLYPICRATSCGSALWQRRRTTTRFIKPFVAASFRFAD